MRVSRLVLFRGRHFRDEIIVLCLRWYLRYPLSYRNLQEMMAERGLKLDYSATARWVVLYAPVRTSGFDWKCGSRTGRGGWTKRMFVWREPGPIYIGPSTRPGTPSDFLLSPKRDLTAAKAFLQSATLQVDACRPGVINVDGHPAYPGAIEELKRSGELGRYCRCRRAPYLNNILEQDHRFVKKRMISSQWFRSVDGALRTIAGYEAMNIVRKGQIRWLPKADLLAKRSSSIARSASQPDLN
jgi:IS6 family transposase